MQGYLHRPLIFSRPVLGSFTLILSCLDVHQSEFSHDGVRLGIVANGKVKRRNRPKNPWLEGRLFFDFHIHCELDLHRILNLHVSLLETRWEGVRLSSFGLSCRPRRSLQWITNRMQFRLEKTINRGLNSLDLKSMMESALAAGLGNALPEEGLVMKPDLVKMQICHLGFDGGFLQLQTLTDVDLSPIDFSSNEHPVGVIIHSGETQDQRISILELTYAEVNQMLAENIDQINERAGMPSKINRVQVRGNQKDLQISLMLEAMKKTDILLAFRPRLDMLNQVMDLDQLSVSVDQNAGLLTKAVLYAGKRFVKSTLEKHLPVDLETATTWITSLINKLESDRTEVVYSDQIGFDSLSYSQEGLQIGLRGRIQLDIKG